MAACRSGLGCVCCASLMLTASPDPLAAALELVARGVPVFPCDPTSKAPLTERGHLDATTDAGQVRQWWDWRRGALLWGVPTGRRTGLAVLDVDIDPGKGIDGRKALEASGRFPPVTRAHLTPRGGLHLLYKLGDGETCPSDASKLGPGLDRRGDGGYVIWYPAHGGTVLNGDIPSAPPDWLTMPVVTGKDAVRVVTRDTAREIYDAALSDAEGAVDGEHNTSLSRAAFICGQLVAAGFVTAEVAGNDLYRVSQTYPETSKTRRDAVRIIEKQLRRGGEHPGFEDVESALHRAFGDKVQWTPRGLLVDGLDVLTQPAPAVWLIRDVMEQGVNAMIYGQSNAGKSFVTIDWSLSIACGIDWCGHAVEQGPVVYVLGEGNRGFRRRVMAWVTARGKKWARGMFRMTEAPVALNDPRAFNAICAEIDSGARPILIVIDTKARATPGWDENTPLDSGRYQALVDELQKRYACAVLTVHHEAKTSKGSSAGHYSLRGAMDNEWSVTGVGADKPPWPGCLLEVTKLKDGEAMRPVRFKFADVMIPWFDDRGVQQRSAVLELDESEAGAPAAVTGVKVKKLTVNDRLLLQAAGYVDEATVTDQVLDYSLVRTAFIQMHGAADKRDSTKAFTAALSRLEDRGCFELNGNVLTPSVWAIRRDLRGGGGSG